MYGRIIQLIRKSKGLSQDELSTGIMSRSNLSNFENEQYIPAFDKVILLLSKLNITVEEYLSLSKQTNVQYQFLYQELVKAENYGTPDELIDINAQITYFKLESSKYYELYLLSQYVLSLYQLPYKISLKEIKNYIKPLLFENEQWFNYELKLYNNFLFLFDYSENYTLYNNVLKKLSVEKYPSISERYKVHLSINFGIQLLEHNQEKEAKKVLAFAKKEAQKEKLITQEVFIDFLLSEFTKSHDIRLVRTKWKNYSFSLGLLKQ